MKCYTVGLRFAVALLQGWLAHAAETKEDKINLDYVCRKALGPPDDQSASLVGGGFSGTGEP